MLRVKRMFIVLLGVSMILCFGTYVVQAQGQDAGEYILFAVENEGYTVDSDDMDMTSVLTLAEDGTGYMTMNEEGIGIVSWSQEGSSITFTAEDETVIDIEVKSPGLLKMTLYEGYYLYFAAEGADTSSVEALSLEEALEQIAQAQANMPKPDSKLYALWDTLKPDEGIHLNYDLHTEELGTDTRYDVQSKGGIYYSRRSMLGELYEGLDVDTVTFFQDGNAYNLKPGKKTGILVTSTSSDYIKANAIQMDDLFAAISNRAPELEYTEEDREMDGEHYLAEIYPSDGAYTPEAVFLFDEEGNLAYFITNNEILGELVYKINIIDDEVDETLLDISDYEITQL